MKKTLYLLSLSIFLLSATCKKSNEDLPPPGGGGPNVTVINNGFLSCIGRNQDNHHDTMTFYYSASGTEMTVFGRPFLRDQDEIHFTTNGDNTINIKLKVPHVHNGVSYNLFGIEENTNPVFSLFPDHKYLWTLMQKDETILNHFVIKRETGDNKKFTLESKAYPGYYLGVAKWKNATYPTTTRLVYTTTPVTFWFEHK